jgi:hypothetical protein
MVEIVYCPPLEVYGYGDDEKEALTSTSFATRARIPRVSEICFFVCSNCMCALCASSKQGKINETLIRDSRIANWNIFLPLRNHYL